MHAPSTNKGTGAGETPRKRDQHGTETMRDFEKKPSAQKVRLQYVVLATLLVACFATYILGVLTDALGLDLNVWVQLQAGIWMWTAMVVLAMLPGSLKETMGRVWFLVGLFGLLLPLPTYVWALNRPIRWRLNGCASPFFRSSVWCSHLVASADTHISRNPVFYPAGSPRCCECPDQPRSTNPRRRMAPRRDGIRRYPQKIARSRPTVPPGPPDRTASWA